MGLRVWTLGITALLLSGCATQPAATVTEIAPAAAPSPAAADAAIERATATAIIRAGQPVRIDNPYGDVRLRFGGYESVLEWRTVAQNGAAAAKIAVSSNDAGSYTVSARLPTGTSLEPGQRVDMTVYVPDGHNVEVQTELGLIEARGLKGGLKVRSTSGDISFRGVNGLIDVETGSGSIEGQIEHAPAGSRQRLVTQTGNIILGLTDGLNATLAIATSGVFATDFSISIDPQPGQEPNKRGVAVIGKPASNIEVASKRGEIRLLRRIEYRPA